jgi:hypothetical protein
MTTPHPHGNYASNYSNCAPDKTAVPASLAVYQVVRQLEIELAWQSISRSPREVHHEHDLRRVPRTCGRPV